MLLKSKAVSNLEQLLAGVNTMRQWQDPSKGHEINLRGREMINKIVKRKRKYFFVSFLRPIFFLVNY